MCGIVGQINTRGPVDSSLFEKMLETLAHRGPNGTGVEVLSGGAVALGHRRLAIIDLSDAAAQPMSNEDGTVWLVANGEIYNFRDLRHELVAAGHTFHSHCDSEVIVHAYEEWGDPFVRRLRGIFSLALWDENRQRLFLARDRLGVKPLYYWNHLSGFVFASQPRAILADPCFTRTIDMEALRAFLACRYVPGSMAIYGGMAKLPPAHTLIWERSTIRINRYWTLEYRPEVTDSGDAADLIRERIEEAVRLELVSDVEVGVYLSGGVDSSTLCSIATSSLGNPMSTVTMGFDVPEYDERPFARRAAALMGAVNHEAELSLGAAIRLIPSYINLYDEPFFDHSGLPTLAVSKLAQGHGLKVLLSGEGGDELFAGYMWYEHIAKSLEVSKLTKLKNRLRRPFRKQQTLDPLMQYFDINGILDAQTQSTLLKSTESFDNLAVFRKEFSPELPLVTALQLLDIKLFLADDLLVKLDHASMACGIEARVPLLDYRLVEAAFSIDVGIVFDRGERKALMKRAVRGLVPDELLTPRKKGFSVPLKTWMESGLHDIATCLVDGGVLVDRGIFDGEGVRGLLARRQPKSTWIMLVTELWARRWLELENLEQISQPFDRWVPRPMPRTVRPG